MPRDLATLIAEMAAQGHFQDITQNPLAQFGTPARRYIGAELLPEQTVTVNAYREEAIKYRSVIANDGTRYSPVQKKGGELVGQFLVELGHSDIGRELDARSYDALVRAIGQRDDMTAIETLLNWSDTVLNRAMVEHNEKQIWDAIVTAQIILAGDYGFTETVAYSNPSGHRFNAASVWSNNANDPFVDIMSATNLLASKGYTVSRIICGRPVATILMNNQKVQARVGLPVVNVSGSIVVAQQQASIAAINGALQANGLPPLEIYDLQYRTSTGTGYFLARNVMVLVSETGIDSNLDLGDNERILRNILGYNAIGVPAGQPNPGRVIRVEAFTNKPPRIEGEAWQASIPVITEPEAISVIGAIS